MSIFNFEDYKKFLRARITALPKKGRGEIGKIAVHLRVNSTLISQIISGPKDFTLEQSQEIAAYFGLSDLEADYLLLLVQIERAGTQKLKQYYQQKRDALKKASLQIANRVQTTRTLNDQERAVFYSNWIYSAVRLFCSVGDGKSMDEIAQKFSMSRARTSEILRFLVDTGLCAQKESLYVMGSQRTHLEKGSPFLSRLHSNWRIKAIQKSDSLDDDELMFTAPFSVSRKDFSKFREDLVQVIKRFTDLAAASEAEDVACFNLDLFWE
jgi:uncharacterized protein (TIGR02147 family)